MLVPLLAESNELPVMVRLALPVARLVEMVNAALVPAATFCAAGDTVSAEVEALGDGLVAGGGAGVVVGGGAVCVAGGGAVPDGELEEELPPPQAARTAQANKAPSIRRRAVKCGHCMSASISRRYQL